MLCGVGQGGFRGRLHVHLQVEAAMHAWQATVAAQNKEVCVIWLGVGQVGHSH